jgi:predicted amidohydrolase
VSADRLRLAIVQPRYVVDPDPSVNVDIGVDLIGRAASSGAQLVLFPEGSPGPDRVGFSYDGAPRLREAARSAGIAVCWSRVELCADGHHRLVAYVVDADGREICRYEKSHPGTVPPSETGGWLAPGENLALVEIAGVPMGIVICFELWFPEPARILAIRGAEVILSPAGGRFSTLTSNWQALARARAIENLCYVALTNGIYGAEVGAALIAGPEHVLIQSGTEELLIANLDLTRVRWLRAQDESMKEPKLFSSIPGLLRARRPELYGELAERADGLFDYHTPPPAEPT